MGLLDDAATCVVAYQYKSQCILDAKSEVCLLVCCCNKFPMKPKKNLLRQLCVDRLMAAKETEKRGILPGVPFDMRKNPPQTFGGTDAWGDGKYVATIAKCVKIVKDEDGSNYRSRRVRVPDVVVLNDPNGPVTQDNIAKIYEIKFPTDRWGKKQREDYERIASSDKNIGKQKVEELNVKECMCVDEDLVKDPVNEEVRQNALSMSRAADGALQKFMQQTEGYSPRGYSLLPEDIIDLREELERQAAAARGTWQMPKIPAPTPQDIQNLGTAATILLILGAIALAPVGI
jgi:hypothetical protein